MLRNPHDRAIFAIALPALGGLAVDPLVSLVDTAFVGRLGTVELAALGVNASLFTFSFIIFNFLAYGTTPRVSRALGAKDHDAAGRAVMEAFTLALIAGLVAMAALQLFAAPLLGLMGAEGPLLDPALDYLRVRALAGPAVLLITAGRGTFRGFLDTRTPLRIVVGMNLINLALDPLLIFGAGWGLIGAATATVIAQWTGALIFVWLVFVKRREAMGIRIVTPSVSNVLPFLGTGAKLLVRTGALVGTMTLATAVATRIGVIEVAAHQIAVQLWMFMALAIDALAVSGQSLVANALGEDEPEMARAIARRLLQWGLAFGALLAGAFWLARPLLPHVFSEDAATIEAVLQIFVFVAALQPLNGLVFVWDGIFMGVEDFTYLAAAMIASALLAGGCMIAALEYGWGLSGVWWGITMLMGTRILTLGWRHATHPVLGWRR